MFFVIRGTVVLSAFDGSGAKECQTGDFFADCCLLFPEKCEEKAMAKTFCELHILEKQNLTPPSRIFIEEDRTLLTVEWQPFLKGGGADGGGSSSGSSGSEFSHLGTAWRLPSSTFRVRWDFPRFLCIIFVAFEVPYYIVFISNHNAQQNFLVEQEIGLRYAATLLVELFFIADLILRARFFAYLDPTAMLNVVDSEMIFAAYKANGFYLDLFAATPIGLIMEPIQGAAEDFSWGFRVSRLCRLRYLLDLIQDLGDYYGMSSKFQLVMSLLLGVTLSLHMTGCLWFAMAWVPLSWNGSEVVASSEITRAECLHMATHFQNCSWVRFDCYGHIGSTFPIEDKDSIYKASFAYLRSLYWAAVALTAVGYGDIVAFSTAESYFAALWVFIGGIINFGVVGAMSSTISNLMANQHHHVEKLNTINNVMEHLRISEKLRTEIRRFYHHQFTGRKKAYESQLLSHLPDQLCYQISSLLHSEATKCVTLFGSASREFLDEVTGKFRHRTYQNGETFVFEGDTCKEFIVILHGKFDAVQRKFADDINDIISEASQSWADDMSRRRKIARNLEYLKLQPHALATTSMFYQKDSIHISDVITHGRGGSSASSSNHRTRDPDTVQANIQSVWKIILTFCNIYNAFVTIFRIAFHSHARFSSGMFTAMWIADIICDIFFVMDVYLRLYYFGCEEVGLENLVERKAINAWYRKSNRLKLDLVASLPLYVIDHHRSFASSMCRLPRLIRCCDLWTYLDDMIIQIQQAFASQNVSSYLSPLKLLFSLLLIAHYAACIFFWISEYECANSGTFVELVSASLRGWSILEYFFDVLCCLHLIKRVRQSIHYERKILVSAKGKSAFVSGLSLTRSVVFDGAFRSDIVAVFPLDLVVFGLDLPLSTMEYPETWKHLSFLRLNKFLYAARIEALSESLVQYVVYDVKVRIPEAFMYFMRSLASYLMMGHYIACTWFAASEKAYHVYSYSWLSTSGMPVSVSGSSHSSEHSGAVDLAHISLTRKYFRAMHFAIGSITTLFYGDIVSTNLIELFIEMGVILWSIYIYGTLVGAHGEMQEFHSRRKAVFEQNLSELQHYLVLNEVPKGLKKQVKQYYASIWRRRRGEEEFDAIATISRTLQEDVVYATLHRFAWKVSIFHALDVHFLRALLVRLTFVICSESEEVVIRGDVDRSMYFISHGRVLVKQDKYEVTKEKGEFFGELPLLYGLPRHETCISLTISELYRLDHDPYEELLRDFPEYRAKNKLDWTTAEPAPSVLSSLLHTLTTSGGGAAAEQRAPGVSFAGDDEKSMATTVTAGSGIAEEGVPRCYVYRATMEMLAQLDKLDTLEAKEIITKGRVGARTYLKRMAGVETSRGHGGVDVDEDDESESLRVRDDAVRNFDSTNSPGLAMTSEDEDAGGALLFTGSATAKGSRAVDAETSVPPMRKVTFERGFSASTIN
ncbi:Voltage-gated ion channel, partial [Globisporangium splendens]